MPGDVILSAKLRVTEQMFSKVFADQFSATPVYHPSIAMVVPSAGGENVYPMIARTIKLRKWAGGERLAQSIATYDYTLRNEDYEGTVSVPRSKILDDQLGFYSSAIVPQIATAARKHADRQLAATIRAGKTTATYDGKAFFATDHPISKVAGKTTAQANLLTSKALTKANAVIARKTMAGFKGDDGELLGFYADTLVVPPSLEDAALTVAAAPFVSDGTTTVTNTQANRWKVIVVPELEEEADVWYAVAGSEPLKPFIVQEREAITPASLVSRVDLEAESVWRRNEFEWGVFGRYGFGFGLWQQAIRCEG